MPKRVLTEEQRKLAEENMSLVPFIINRAFKYEMSRDEDYVSIGYLALCDAAATYDSKTGNAFSTYACNCIVNAVKKELNKCNRKKRDACTNVWSLNFKPYIDLYDGVDDPYEVENGIPDSDESMEDNVINRLTCEKVWSMLPTYTALQSSGLPVKVFARRNRISRQTVYSRVSKELDVARSVLEGRPLRKGVKKFAYHL